MAETHADTPRNVSFPCPQCGALLRFSPAEGQLRCDHCGYAQAVEAPPAAPAAPRPLGQVPRTRTRPAKDARRTALTEHDLQAALADALAPAAMEERRTVSCPSCGATFELDPAVHADECPFCATPVVADTGPQRQIKPQALIPFRIAEREAREAMKAWLGRLWFAPNRLVDYARKGRAMTGVYVPYWTFDAATRSAYTGQRGEYWYETRTVMVEVNGRMQPQQETIRHTAWYPVAGEVARDFDDILVMASEGLPRRYLDGLAPWDLDALDAYRAEFLAGFRAESYTVGLDAGHAIARAEMDAVIRGDVARDIGGDEQIVESVDTRARDETFKHLLLPIWMAAYKYNGKSYRFVINAQTGKVQGERPWSAWKIAGAVVAVAVAAGALYLYYNNVYLPGH